MPRCTVGRSSTARTSGSWYGSSARCAARAGLRRLVDGERMPGATWFPEARLNFAENLLRARDASLAIAFWGEDQRQAPALPAPALRPRVAPLAGARRSRGEEGRPRRRPTCRTCPSRWPRCWRPRASARSGRRARRTSACRACSTDSVRSNRRSSSAPMATTTAAGRFDPGQGGGDPARGCRRSSAAWYCPTSGEPPEAGIGLDAFIRPYAPRRSASSRWNSTTRSTSCIRRARPARRSASCTAPAARCCST